MIIFGIDPGVNTGIAVYNTKYKKVIDCGIIKIDNKLTIPDRIAQYCGELVERYLDFICSKPDSYAIIESTNFWESSEESRVCANTGGLVWLAYLTGAYIQICNRAGMKVVLVHPLQWKGNLSLDIVKERNMKFFKLLNLEKSPHINSAMGLIKYYVQKEKLIK